MEEITYPDGFAIVHSYDNTGSLFEIRRKDDNTLTRNFSYDNSGNLTYNSGLGNLNYEGDKPHAVSSVELFSNSTISTNDCIVEYNFFHKPTSITEGTNELLLSYGADKQREKSIYKVNGITQKTKIFISALYEKEQLPRNVRHLNYIYAETGLVAIRVKSGSVFAPVQEDMYYVLTDHLGSYNMILDQNKNVKDSLHFDPWGNRKRYEDWSRNDTRTSFHFDRGFTGHEHLDRFKIINMNGRLYDPLLARFFSPDPYVQMPDFTQNYNRYSYCLNNPLMFTDPSGNSMISDLLYGFSNFLSMPARIITEGVSWVEDQMDGRGRTGGYFRSDYLLGSAPPYDIPITSSDRLSPYGVDNFPQEFYEPMGQETMLGSDNSYYERKATIITTPYIDMLDKSGYKLRYDFIGEGKKSWYWVETGKSSTKTEGSRGRWLDPETSAGITYGSSLTGGFFSTASMGMAEFATASKVLKVGGVAAGVVGLGTTAMEIRHKYINGETNTADWINLALTGAITVAGLFVSAPAMVAGAAIVGFGYGIYRVAAGDKADAWINNKIGYR